MEQIVKSWSKCFIKWRVWATVLSRYDNTGVNNHKKYVTFIIYSNNSNMNAFYMIVYSVMQVIKDAGDLVHMKMVHSDNRVVMQVTASPC